jgi:hypothetical protein
MSRHRLISHPKKQSYMKKFVIFLSVLAAVGCNNARKAEEQANRENAVRQRTIDSIEAARASRQRVEAAEENNTAPADHTATEAEKKKGMSNTTKGALIGTGAGIATGAATGAAVNSKDRGKGAVIGGVVGGAVGSGVGYGIGAHKDKKEKDAQESK